MTEKWECSECGGNSFVVAQVIDERALYDENMEFVKVIDADTKDRYDSWCNACGSRKLKQLEGKVDIRHD